MSKQWKYMQTFNVIGRNTIYLLIDCNWVKLTLFVSMIVMENLKITRFRIKFKWSAKEEIIEPKLFLSYLTVVTCSNLCDMPFWRYLPNIFGLYLPKVSCSYLPN